MFYILFTGNQAGDQVIYTILSTGPMIGGVIAILLDNILPGMYLHTPLQKASYFSRTVSYVCSNSLKRRHVRVKLSKITTNLTSFNSFFRQTTKNAPKLHITVPLWGEPIGNWLIPLKKGPVMRKHIHAYPCYNAIMKVQLTVCGRAVEIYVHVWSYCVFSRFFFHRKSRVTWYDRQRQRWNQSRNKLRFILYKALAQVPYIPILSDFTMLQGAHLFALLQTQFEIRIFRWNWRLQRHAFRWIVRLIGNIISA